MRTLKTYKRLDGLVKAVVRLDTEWDEFQVWLFRAGREVKAARYHAADEQDAHGTARLMVAA
jgi:hypothetical protein